MQELFEAVREAASSAAWSRGVELARGGAVSGEGEADGELTLRVATRGGLISPTVILMPDDADWDCDCGTHEEACEHVAAAVISTRRARSEGRDLPEASGAAGRIGYRLSRDAQGLALERVVVSGDEEALLVSTLAAVASGRVDGPKFVATQADLAVEQTLGSRRRGRLPRGLLLQLLPRLAACSDVQLDGVPVTTSREPIGWQAVVEDDDAGFRLRVARIGVAERFDECVGLCDGALRPLGETRLSGREIEDLTGAGRHFDADRAAELVTEVLPSLGRRVPVDVRTKRLPKAVHEPPRLVVEVTREGDALSALATLVYGDPPSARVDAGRLVPLGGGALPLRDENEERALARRLQSDLELLPGHRVRLEGAAAVSFAERLRRWRGIVRGGAHERFFLAPALEPSLEVGASDFDLDFTAQVDGKPRSAAASNVIAAWRRGDPLVALEGGGFAPLPKDWLERCGGVLADLLAAREPAGALPACALPDLARLCEELGEPVPPAFERMRRLVADADGLPSAALPADLSADLRGYQRRGVDWLCALRDGGLGALLADDMGLGKTLQALCALKGRALVVCPTSVIDNWEAEARRFRPSLRCSVYHGPARELDPEADLTLTTYAILRLDAERLAGIEWDAVVLDESQHIKNPDSQVARAAHSLRAGFRMALTGTPIENRLEELWSQLHFTNRGLLGSRRDFDERYSRPIAAGDGEAAGRLRDRIRPFILRRLKREVAPELPPRTEVVLHAELDEEERRLYDAIRAATREDVVRQLEAGGSVFAALEALLRLRQAACHPALVPGGRGERSSKLDVLLEMLEESAAEGHKALVFSQWTSLLDRVEPHLSEAGLDFTRLDGSTRDRGAVVAGFQADDGPPVMLISLRAGGTGLNLTAADCVFILDPWWNPAVEDQAADRAHRIGQERPVMVYRLVAKDTVEERILALQERKRGLAEAALGEAGRAASLSRDELLDLLV